MKVSDRKWMHCSKVSHFRRVPRGRLYDNFEVRESERVTLMTDDGDLLLTGLHWVQMKSRKFKIIKLNSRSRGLMMWELMKDSRGLWCAVETFERCTVYKRRVMHRAAWQAWTSAPVECSPLPLIRRDEAEMCPFRLAKFMKSKFKAERYPEEVRR